MKRRTLVSMLAAAALSIGMLAPTAPAIAAPPAPSAPTAINNHGTIPLTATTVAGAATGVMPDGSPRTWAAISGKPAYLAEINPVTGEMLNQYYMPGASGGWGVELAEDGTVWVAPYGNGHIFYLPYGATELVDAGQVTSNTSFTWQIDTDANGVAYFGTFEGFGVPVPGGHLASYDKTTQQFRDYGSFGDEYRYVRSTAVIGDKIYAGTGTPGAFFEVDIATGEKRQLPLPPGITAVNFVYEMATSGTDLYVRFEGTKKEQLGAVYDTVKGEWVAGPWTDFNSQRVARDSAGNTYYAVANKLWMRSPDGTETNLGVSMLAKGIGVTVIDGQEYVIGVSGSLMNRYNIVTGELTQISTQLIGSAVASRGYALGPDGQVHFGGYFSGGFASFSDTEGWSFDSRLGQAEGFATVGDRLFAGIYPGAKVYEVDPSRPLTDGNPKLVFALTEDGQDRPFGMADAGGLLAVGTVAGYGSNNGMLAIYNPETGQLDKYPDLIPNQGIVTLNYRDGILYGGTSIYGGTSSTPVTENATLFAFDMASRTLLWTQEIEGAQIVSGVAAASGGQVWAATVGKLYAFKSDTGRQVYEQEITPYDWSNFQGGTWQFDNLAFNEADGYLYGSVGGKIIRIQPNGQRQSYIVPDVGGMKLVLDGQRTYWVSGQTLYSADWPMK